MTYSVCFDVLGTCFHFDPAIAAIDERLGSQLKAIGVDPKTLFFSWFYSAQRDFTYTSIAGPDRYTPIAEIFAQTFRRACAIVDFPDVKKNITDEDVKYVMSKIKALPPREGLKGLYDGLRDAGWDVYGVTNGGKATSLGYYEQAGIELDADHLLSCDDLKIAKPDVRVYENANKWLTSRGLPTQNSEGNNQRWFVAAHAWDLLAARQAGFKTAYLEFEEHDPCTGIFGEFDLYAKDCQELLSKLKEVSN